MAATDNPPPNHETEAHAVHTVTNQMIEATEDLAQWRCADVYMLCGEKHALKESIDKSDEIRADLQQLEEESGIRGQTETSTESKEHRKRIAELREEVTTIAHAQVNCSRETIKRLESRLMQYRYVLGNIQEAAMQVEEVVERKVKEENSFIRVLRIYCCLQILQDIRNTKLRYHVLPPKQTSPAQNHARVLLQIKRHHQKQVIREAAVAAARQATIRNQKRTPTPTKEACNCENKSKKNLPRKTANSSPSSSPPRILYRSKNKENGERSMSTMIKCKRQARTRVPETETIDEMVKRLTDELDGVIEDLELSQGEADLEEHWEQARYLNDNNFEFNGGKDVMFEELLTSYSKSRVRMIETPKSSETAKTRVRNRQLRKSRVMGRRQNAFFFRKIFESN